MNKVDVSRYTLLYARWHKVVLKVTLRPFREEEEERSGGGGESAEEEEAFSCQK